jgi:hypothetical protein
MKHIFNAFILLGLWAIGITLIALTVSAVRWTIALIG